VLLRVLACALCGSDLRPLRQGWPVTPGHEILGRVQQPGHSWDGRRALVYIPVFCGRCEDCARGDTHLCCNATDLMGWQRDGGYAEALAVPEQCLLPVPDDIPDSLAPLLLDAIGTTGHGLRLAQRIVPGGSVLLLGAGPIGLGAQLRLRGMGYGPVCVVEPGTRRAAFAASRGPEPSTHRPRASSPSRWWHRMAPSCSSARATPGPSPRTRRSAGRTSSCFAHSTFRSATMP
jgi:L-iditol 2-dehydrogenase